jgi:hypothetical protein
MMKVPSAWPGGQKIAVSVTLMFETWSETGAPGYSVQSSGRKPGYVNYGGQAWASYGGHVGVWRLLDVLDRQKVPGTFFVSGKCTEDYPDTVREIVKRGYDVGVHSYVQDESAFFGYLTVEEQREIISKSIESLSSFTGQMPTGWSTPGMSLSPHTNALLAEVGLKWHTDVNYTDLPHVLETPAGLIAAVPTSDFADLRVLQANVRDFFDAYKAMIEHLERQDEIGMVSIVIHCLFGGRPLIAGVLEDLLVYFKSNPNIWITRHDELAQWAFENTISLRDVTTRFKRR